jgi:hypothetical protein
MVVENSLMKCPRRQGFLKWFDEGSYPLVLTDGQQQIDVRFRDHGGCAVCVIDYDQRIMGPSAHREACPDTLTQGLSVTSPDAPADPYRAVPQNEVQRMHE